MLCSFKTSTLPLNPLRDFNCTVACGFAGIDLRTDWVSAALAISEVLAAVTFKMAPAA